MPGEGHLPEESPQGDSLNGPGYSGGNAFGNTYSGFGEPVPASAHTFAVEWEPGLISWYVDDILYHSATPADVATNAAIPIPASASPGSKSL